ncbi:unnamed protein product [Arabis nemorensis]|uniref:Protease Do-like PDZ domain-containing protein n=1 Tax=Arabis nemorensis TaxID=586526 RepID=A0A565B495_9BRAS|nr:unnamed protein product [Arabis nemorensis]
MTGIVVTRVYKLSRRIKTLMENDVLLAVNGNPIQNDGEVSIGINLEGFIALKKPMENVCFDVLRKGVISQMTLRLSNMDNSQDGRDYPPPTYFIVGGFVFTNSEDGVKISQVLENEVNIGYTIFRDSVVVMVNGEVVYNVKAMRKMIEEAKKCPITTHVRLLLHCGGEYCELEVQQEIGNQALQVICTSQYEIIEAAIARE